MMPSTSCARSGAYGFRLGSATFASLSRLAQRFRTLGGEPAEANDRLIGERHDRRRAAFSGRSSQRAAPHSSTCSPISSLSDQSPHDHSFSVRPAGDGAHHTCADSVAPGISGSGDAHRRKQPLTTLARPITQFRCVTHWPLRPVRSCCGLAISPLRSITSHCLLDLSTRHALPSWGAMGRTFQGVLAIRRGDLDPGLRQLRADFDELGAVSDLDFCAVTSMNWQRVSPAPGRPPTGSPRSSRQSSEPSIQKNVGCFPSCCASRASFCCCSAPPERPRRPRITSGRRSTGRAGKVPCPWNCAPPRASLGCCVIRAAPPTRRLCSSLSMTGSPKGSIPPI